MNKDEIIKSESDQYFIVEEGTNIRILSHERTPIVSDLKHLDEQIRKAEERLPDTYILEPISVEEYNKKYNYDKDVHHEEKREVEREE